MSGSVRPRRSMLYMPASNARVLEKAKALPADGLIFDLEDAVAPDQKADARAAAVAAAKTRGYGPREVLIRVNGLETTWSADDLEAGGAVRRRRHRVAQGLQCRRRPRRRECLDAAGRRRHAPDLVHDGNAARHSRGGGDRAGERHA